MSLINKKPSSEHKCSSKDGGHILSEDIESLTLVDSTGNAVLKIDHSDEPIKINNEYVVKLKPSL